MSKTITSARDRVGELRKALETKAAEIDGYANNFKDETGNGHFVLSTAEYKSYSDAITEAEQIKAALITEEKAAGIREFLEAPAGVPLAQVDAANARGVQMQSKGLYEQWTESEAWKDLVDSKFNRFGQIAEFKSSLYGLQTKAQGDVYTEMGGDITLNALGSAQDVGMITRMLRPGRVRDLFPVQTTTAYELWGVRQTGYVNRAWTVPDRVAADGVSPATGGPTDTWGAPPKSDISVEAFRTSVSTISHIMYEHKHTLSDEPRLRGIIDRELVDGIKTVEDFMLLYGDGQGENLKGLANQEGIQLYTGQASDALSAQIRRAITRVSLTYFDSTGIVLHPLDWEALELEKDANGQYVIAVSVAIGGEKRTWRNPVVDTAAVNQGRYFLGAWGKAAQVFDRQEVALSVSTDNRDYFEKGVITIKGEERLAFLCERPEAMLHGTFTPPA